jgi:hypothetical protein
MSEFKKLHEALILAVESNILIISIKIFKNLPNNNLRVI